MSTWDTLAWQAFFQKYCCNLYQTLWKGLFLNLTPVFLNGTKCLYCVDHMKSLWWLNLVVLVPELNRVILLDRPKQISCGSARLISFVAWIPTKCLRYRHKVWQSNEIISRKNKKNIFKKKGTGGGCWGYFKHTNMQFRTGVASPAFWQKATSSPTCWCCVT